MTFHWKTLPPSPSALLEGGAWPPLLCQLLHNRGVRPEDWEAFLEADARLSVDPLDLPDMERAVSRIYRALLSGETIAIYGDYDADGITATVILVEGLQALGARIITYIPNRLEGHGLHPPALASLAERGASLVITADGGTSSYQEVAQAQQRGQDIIITDHHACTEPLPPAVGIVNPKREEGGRQLHLAGVGVAFKLVQALFQGLGREEGLERFYDLVAVGTVTDMVPLLGENRFLVREGLKRLNGSQRVGLLEMYKVAGVEPGQIDARTISWVLGPRLNAAGRMEHAYLSYHLLLTSSAEEGRGLALELEQKNIERQRLVEEAWQRTKEMAFAQREAKLLFIAGQAFPPGVAGLVAGRLVNEFQRPAVVVRQGEETSRGSARSIPEFDLVEALTECAPWLERFGGHPQAAGFVLPNSNLEALHQALVGKANRELAGVDLKPQLTIDAHIPLSVLGGNTYQMCQKLSPFGSGNPEPTFLSSRVQLVEARSVGNGGDHLKLNLKEGGVAWSAIGFGLGQRCAELTPALDLVYQLTKDSWAGSERLELRILDFRPAVP